MAKRRRKTGIIALLLAVGGLGGAGFWVQSQIQPLEKGKPFFVRYEKRQRLGTVLADLASKKTVRNPTAMFLYAIGTRKSAYVASGTYQFTPGLSADDILSRLARPLRARIRIPQAFWAARTGAVLEAAQVCSAQSYVAQAKQPEQFKPVVSFPLPAGSLEGYLLADTYELPPLTGARKAIERQLQAFDKKIWRPLGGLKEAHRTLTVASLVELEVKRDSERAIVAGVIENRLAKGIPLQIDASINYALQDWRPLAVSEYQSVKSPYNLYLNKGIPPGPICSPSLKSIEAALHPIHHNYLYYVAMPDGTSRFSATLAEHLKNVKLRKSLLAKHGKRLR